MENHNHQQLIEKLLNCANTCEICFSHCLSEGGMMANCAKLDRDCADSCRHAIALLQSQSVIGHQYLVLCEEICRKCAEECAQHQHEHCQRCAQACQECAEACHSHHEQITQR
ncbi:four-helix bundle copper-binding protein [Adhaeribacter rhizoryzae]|uniref:Four-helix bundle copper-binding protein n=1 Tax=Adhaeribacter rhizoryzae TaxID=2607907 RepID=A0A5M6D3U9_9BACT|nr:four-helix bundle copper-binding protein [Adhaeribacter rhizoryzae]KAA5542003.1 four-helix bundle copper-binding protein [Adhaeribacter rhizoryzae]